MALPVRECDLLVAGSGAGGLAAAVTAARLGLQVIVAEKEAVYGGTTAWSGGWLWIPRNPLARAAGIRETIDGPRGYLRHELGEQYDPARIEAFLRHGPAMVEFFQRQTALQFIDGNAVPDFHGRSPGALEGGRSVCAAPFDAREAGPWLERLRQPLDLIAPWGMGIASGADLRHFLNAMRAWPSFRHVSGRVARHFVDLLRYRRGQHLVGGNALAARLGRCAADAGVVLLVDSPVERLQLVDGCVRGAVLNTPEGALEVRARHGVVLATGGCPHAPDLRARLFPAAHRPAEHCSAAPFANTGDGLRLGESAGAALEDRYPAAAGYCPVSKVPRADGSQGHFPHLIERAKPGLIAVLRNGRRFVNEADSYHDFMNALFAASLPDQPVHAWLVCDRRFIRRYGLGYVRPAPFPLGPALRSGYLLQGASVAALAAACGIDAGGLAETIERCNQAARKGHDAEFGKGDTPYNRVQGDPGQQPNPCLAPLERGPFYAVRVMPGSLGTFAGLRTDAQARVLNAHGRPVDGLYACGADMASVMGGHYPSGGITLGPAMTFGFIAAHHAAGAVAPALD